MNFLKITEGNRIDSQTGWGKPFPARTCVYPIAFFCFFGGKMRKPNRAAEAHQRLLAYEAEKKRLRCMGVVLTQEVLDRLIKKYRV